MPLLDLVTPWAATLATPDPADAAGHYFQRHSATLERVRRQRAPHADRLPLATDPVTLQHAAARASNSSLQQGLRRVAQLAAELGADSVHTTVLLAGEGDGEPALAIPGEPPLVALFLDLLPDESALLSAKLRAQAMLTRWLAPDSASPLRAATQGGPWDYWALASSVSLREWVYCAGVACHLAHATLPDTPDHLLLGLRRGELRLLRERERALHALLAADLDQSGIGLVLRWLTPDTPPSVRTVGGYVVPPGAGRYLGWRMTADRVVRAGLRAALRLSA